MYNVYCFKKLLSGNDRGLLSKTPVLAITSHIGSNHIGNLRSQVIDRRIIPNDVAQMSVELPIPKDESEDFLLRWK